MVGHEEPVWYLWKKTWEFSRGNRKNVVLYIIMSVIANIFVFLQPLVLAKLLNVLQLEGISQDNLFKILVIVAFFVFTIAGFWLFHGPSRIIERKNAFFVRLNYKKYLVDGVLSMPSKWHQEHHSGDTIDKIEKGTVALYQYSGGTFEVIETIVRLVGCVAALFYFNLMSGFVAIFFIIVAVLIILRYDKRLINYYKEINHAENATSQKVFDFVSNINTVIILRLEKVASSEIYKKIRAPFNVFMKYVVDTEIKWALVSLISSCMIFFVLSVYLIKEAWLGGIILVGTVVALYGYVDRLSGLFFRFAYKYGDITLMKANVENAEELSNEFKQTIRRKQILMEDWKALEIVGLTFSYNSFNEKKHDELHLNNIHINLHKGEKIALIGESGSGKTTFLKLIRGIYAPQKMNLYLVDKKKKKKINGFDVIDDNMSLIPQDPELFAAIIRENINFGMNCSDEELQEYLDAACFTDVVKRLPRHLNSNIKEKGVNLSGGEKQRLALARGLLASRDKEIIMLDEPTSSVDSKNEMKIYQNIFTMYKDKTVISSIHRLHLLPMFDTIYLFEKGKITASGDLETLLKKSSKFKELWKKYHKQKKSKF
ncbi:MAG: ABC transporter ATP-binding protein [Candidatus Woesearchaeota archaeon]|jgi:ABC-type multidrug transport system fused ATPase/permease subunit